MRDGRSRPGSALVAIAVVALLTGACTSGGGATASPSAAATTTPASQAAATTAPSGAATTAPSAAAGPVSVCELAYFTGEFAPYGPALSADVVFPIKEVINLDPPLGRTWVDYHEDLGTVGEAQAARTCLEKDKAEILVSMGQQTSECAFHN